MTYHSAAKGALAAGKKVLIFPSVLISPSEVGIVTSYLAAFTLHGGKGHFAPVSDLEVKVVVSPLLAQCM